MRTYWKKILKMCIYIKICENKKSYFIRGVMKDAYFYSELRNLHSMKFCVYIKIRARIITISSYRTPQVHQTIHLNSR